MKKYKSLTNSETASFCGQLALLLPAGITLLEGIQLMEADAASDEGKELLAQIEASLISGKNFCEALAAANVFPNYVISMALLGEEAGKLDIVMAKLADYYAQQASIAAAIKNAVRYPIIMLCLMTVILIVLLAKVLPVFNQVFSQLGSGLTGFSLTLMKIGGGLQAVSGVFVCIFAASAVVLFILSKNAKCRRRLRRILHSCFLTKNLFTDIAYSRFAGAMAMIVSSGIDIFKGIGLAGAIIENELISKKLVILQNALLDGDDVSEAIKKAEIFYAQHRRLLQISCKTGDSDRVYTKLSEYYENAAMNRLQRLAGAIEPCLVIIFSFTVGIILMSVIMPLIGIMSNIQ